MVHAGRAVYYGIHHRGPEGGRTKDMNDLAAASEAVVGEGVRRTKNDPLTEIYGRPNFCLPMRVAF